MESYVLDILDFVVHKFLDLVQMFVDVGASLEVASQLFGLGDVCLVVGLEPWHNIFCFIVSV